MTCADCRIPADALIGEQGQGFKVAMGVFDIFRPSVGAAAVGLARRALEETLARVSTRTLFGQTMSDLQTVQLMLCDMASDLDTGALAVYRPAWERDCRGVTSSSGPSMATPVPTAAAGRIPSRPAP